MKGRIGVLRFPGTNCDRDVWAAIEASGGTPVWLWHLDLFSPDNFQALVLPGGFSYGDYLRSGALAARAPAMTSVRDAARKGVPILGICNGFQILCEAGLLPGALIRNQGLRFIDDWVELELQSRHATFSARQVSGATVTLPIAHADGRYVLEESDMKRLEDGQQIWWRYKKNPNGSIGNVAGVMNKERNVAGLMPHPERAMSAWMGGSDGLEFFN